MARPVERLLLKESSSKYWPPTPLSAWLVCTPRLCCGGRTHSPSGEGGGGGSIFWKTEDTALYSTYIESSLARPKPVKLFAYLVSVNWIISWHDEQSDWVLGNFVARFCGIMRTVLPRRWSICSVSGFLSELAEISWWDLGSLLQSHLDSVLRIRIIFIRIRIQLFK